MWMRMGLLMIVYLLSMGSAWAGGELQGDEDRLGQAAVVSAWGHSRQDKLCQSTLVLARVEGGGEGGGVSGAGESEPAEEKKYCWEKYGFEIHGSAVGFGQGGTFGSIEGERIGDSSAGGIAFDLEIGYTPPVPFLENGKFFIHAHAGEGKGSDVNMEDGLFANLNTIADNSGDLQLPKDKAFWLQEAYYEHSFCGGKLAFVVGKTETFGFVDDNAFANDANVQFVGKALVNNPVLDSENEFAPLIAATFSPVESVSFSALAVSSSRPNMEEDLQKTVYSRIFDEPMVAAQLRFSPKFGNLQGNYRVYFFDAMYDHSNSAGDFNKDGWGVGVSFDQQVTQCLGLFARLAYSDRDAYDVDWFWSAGANLKGLIASRPDDELGIGIAGVKGHIEPDNDGTEFHAEAYYRIALNEHVALTPDLQWVVNPVGNGDNDAVFAGMIRVELSF